MIKGQGGTQLPVEKLGLEARLPLFADLRWQGIAASRPAIIGTEGIRPASVNANPRPGPVENAHPRAEFFILIFVLVDVGGPAQGFTRPGGHGSPVVTATSQDMEPFEQGNVVLKIYAILLGFSRAKKRGFGICDDSREFGGINPAICRVEDVDRNLRVMKITRVTRIPRFGDLDRP